MREDAQVEEETVFRRWRGGETRCWSLQIQNKMRDRVEQNLSQLRRPFPMR